MPQHPSITIHGARSSGPNGVSGEQWPPIPIPPVGYQSRKSLPIKKNDSDPLTREDVQFDLLHEIFSDDQLVFTNPRPTPGNSDNRITFGELYISTLYNSPKCSKVLKDKMLETPAFATELGKISLLTNVGRINTTMAFFPEMKTALRTYHPVPSLQKTDGNAQDAPRIKNCLKSALLPSETKNVPPSTPSELKDKLVKGSVPTTSVVNLVFILANHAAPLATVHFHTDGSLNFLDLFIPRPTSSRDRARAFLWHMYHYLESNTLPNPFDDAYAKSSPGKAPQIRTLTPEQAQIENIDTEEEKAWGRKMAEQRNFFLRKLVSMDRQKQDRHSALAASSNALLGQDPADMDSNGDIVDQTYHNYSEDHDEHQNGTAIMGPAPTGGSSRSNPRKEPTFMHYVPPVDVGQTATSGSGQGSRSSMPLHPAARQSDENNPPIGSSIVTVFSQFECEPYETAPREYRGKHSASKHGGYGLHAIVPPSQRIDQRFYPEVPIQLPSKLARDSHSMLKHTFGLVVNTDPLQDSDEEMGDAPCRVDYSELSLIRRCFLLFREAIHPTVAPSARR